MSKRAKILPIIVLSVALLLSLALTACGSITTASPFKSFKEVNLDNSIKQAMLVYNTTTRTSTEAQAQMLRSMVEKYYTSDETNLEKLANELDSTLTAQGYTFDTSGSSSLKAQGATKPVNTGDYWVGAYSKPDAPDIVFILSSGSKWYGGKNISWLGVAGADPDALKKFDETLKSSKSVLYTQTATGIFKVYETGATPSPTPMTK